MRTKPQNPKTPYNLFTLIHLERDYKFWFEKKKNDYCSYREYHMAVVDLDCRHREAGKTEADWFGKKKLFEN